MAEARPKVFYRWTRDLHLYIGLFVSPFVFMFAISVLFLNHAKVDTTAVDSAAMAHEIQIPAGLGEANGRQAVDLARQIVKQVGVSGEIGFVRYVRNEQRFVIPVSKPGLETIVALDVATRTATISRRNTGVLESAAYLHKIPGPHNADLRGNWLWTEVWHWIADGTVYLLLFVSASGLYLWFTIKADRRAGLAVFGAGVASFLALIYGLVR
jgi:hypothetical protein